ncbi:hypothetical protein [Bradyrhizobium sp. CCBAU 51753]|uniref:hypothetical protein n=1 Tax=Bradyrhizobium sp. CCBAU 51753 TaxID=1325100 RepID=UPI00188CB8E8|nr:hypothetical protein [Bradyrhizobium sp. CCBAU 51753]
MGKLIAADEAEKFIGAGNIVIFNPSALDDLAGERTVCFYQEGQVGGGADPSARHC